ncbi:MAG: replicative DNA helicase [Pseudomonadota bacterium]
MSAAPHPANDRGPDTRYGSASYRALPANIEAEQALLGALLINNDALYAAGDITADDFSEGLHRQMFTVITDLIRAGKKATPITIKTFLPVQERVGDMTVLDYVVRIASMATTVVNAPDFAAAIRECAQRRALISAAETMLDAAYTADPAVTPAQLVEEGERQLYALAERSGTSAGLQRFAEATTAAVDMIAAAYQRDGGLSGLATGLRTLDAKMGGLQKSDLIVLAGRPAMGKTSLATNIAHHIATAYRPGEPDAATGQTGDPADGGVVAFFSLEMSSEQLATRILSEQAEVSSSSLRRGEVNDTELDKVIMASQAMHKLPLFIDQTGGLTIAQLRARARRQKRQHGLHVAIVDYIQLLSASKTTHGNRVQEVTEITTGLKAMAKELDIPVIALSQLSRGVENRDDKRPQLADLRESGSIEQDADVVLFVYRDEYYAERLVQDIDHKDYEANLRRYEASRGKAEVIVAKQRHGPTGTAHLAFTPHFTRFADLATDEFMPEDFS